MKERREEAFQTEEGAGLEHQAVLSYCIDNGEPLRDFDLVSDLVTGIKEGSGKVSAQSNGAKDNVSPVKEMKII